MRYKLFLFFFSPLLFIGCATYQSKVKVARNYIEKREYEQALKHLKPLADEESGDQLIYLLDYATTQQISGNYKESNEYFFKAEKLADQLDYHSVSRVAGSFLLNEEVVQYKGDTFEKIFINAYLAMNYLELGNLEDALVESRRINEKYLKYKSEDRKNFELNFFAKYLSALIWEADKNYDDAFIAYQEAYKIDSSVSILKNDLIRLAKKSRRDDEYKRLKNEFSVNDERPEWYDKKKAEVIVIYQQGWGPRKNFDSFQGKFPVLNSVYSETTQAEMLITPQENSSTNTQLLRNNLRSEFVYNVEDAAIKTLKDDQASLIARRVGSYVVKEAASYELSKKNKTLGAIANIFLHLSDRADLRQWSTLPRSIQIIRAYIDPGAYEVGLQGLNSSGFPTADKMEKRKIILKPGEKKFIVWRSFN